MALRLANDEPMVGVWLVYDQPTVGLRSAYGRAMIGRRIADDKYHLIPDLVIVCINWLVIVAYF